jgi:hypothetical protein
MFDGFQLNFILKINKKVQRIQIRSYGKDTNYWLREGLIKKSIPEVRREANDISKINIITTLKSEEISKKVILEPIFTKV